MGNLVGLIVRPPPPLLIQMTGWKRKKKNREAEKTRPHVQRFEYSVKSAGQFSLNSSDLLSSPRLSENDPCPFAFCCIPLPRSFGRRRCRWCTSRATSKSLLRRSGSLPMQNRNFPLQILSLALASLIYLLRLRLGGAEKCSASFAVDSSAPCLARSFV